MQELLADALSLVRLGGPVVVVLFAMSVVALAVAVFKAVQIRALTRGARMADTAMECWARCEVDAARTALLGTRAPTLQVLADGMRWLSEGKEPEQVREELVRRAQRTLADASGLLGVLEQVAYLAPLLGLLGTVLGIIDVFQGLAVQGADADAGSLAGGIWEALLTTAVGLCVAIPFAMTHSLLENQVEQLRQRMEDSLTRLFTVSLYRAA